jgi:hypothetical protein
MITRLGEKKQQEQNQHWPIGIDLFNVGHEIHFKNDGIVRPTT